MKIVLDETRCCSLGICESVAPDVFEVADDGQLELLEVSPPETRRVLIEDAVAACPTGALRIED
jgi:ferredoxin